MREIAKKLKISYNAVYYSLHRTAQTGPTQNRKRSGRPQCTAEQEDKYISVSTLRNTHLTSPQMAASLNSTRKTPVSTSTVKRRLRDAFFLCCATWPPTPLSILVSASLCCSVKGVVHSCVRDLQFLGNFSHGIAFISQNKNRLTSFRIQYMIAQVFSNDQLAF